MIHRIAHFDLDSFFVSVERVLNPHLREKDAAGNFKPLVVGGSADKRGVVASASYEARRYGVHSAMPMKTALRLCPHLIIVSGRHGVYSEMSSRIVTRLMDFVPVIEQTSIDEGYMDLTGCEKLFHNDFPAALRYLQKLVNDEFQLPISFGMGTTRVIAKIASGKAKPKGILVVEPGTEGEFLGGLDIGEIPGIGPKTEESLKSRGFSKVAQLQELSRERLINILGKYGDDLFDVVHGKSSNRITTDSERKSISSEETFATDMPSDTDFDALLSVHIEEICYRLRRKQLKAKTVTIKLRYADFSTITRSQSIPATGDDIAVRKVANDLFSKAYDGKTPVRLIGVGLSNFTEDVATLDLFTDSNGKRESILKTVDSIREKFGVASIHIGKTNTTKRDPEKD
jgi:DNA polymerase IV